MTIVGECEVQVNVSEGSTLSAALLHALLQLRSNVFIVEQGLAYADIDGQDLLLTTTHFWIEQADRVAGCVRVVPEASGTRIGRVCTERSLRRKGFGSALLASALERYGGAPVVLDGQAAVLPFYMASGFAVAGAEFIDDGIPHLPMRWVGKGGKGKC